MADTTRQDKAPPKACPLCGHRLEADALLGSLVPSTEAATHADGSREVRSGDFTYRCGGCRTVQRVSEQQAATLLIEAQTRELFASITAVLRGRAKLH
jgi:hypothetical protein